MYIGVWKHIAPLGLTPVVYCFAAGLSCLSQPIAALALDKPTVFVNVDHREVTFQIPKVSLRYCMNTSFRMEVYETLSAFLPFLSLL